MNKSSNQYRMVKADCQNEEIMKKFLHEEIKLDYISIKVEEYRRQCFNCQQY